MLLALDVGNTNTVLGLYRLEEDLAGSEAVTAPLHGSDDGASAGRTAETPSGEMKLAAHWRVTTHRRRLRTSTACCL